MFDRHLKSTQKYNIQPGRSQNFPCSSTNVLEIMSETYASTFISCGSISRKLDSAGTGQICHMGDSLIVVCASSNEIDCLGTITSALDLN